MSELIDVCREDELAPGERRLVEWDDVEIMVVNCDGELRSILKVTRDGQPAKVTETLADGDVIRLGVG